MNFPNDTELLTPNDATIAVLIGLEAVPAVIDQAASIDPPSVPVPITDAELIHKADSIIKSTFFIRVSYGRVGNSKQVKGDVLSTDADKSFLRVSKTLLDSPELAAIGKHDSLIRKWLNNTCLPFYDWPGVLVMPKGIAKAVKDKLKASKVEREGLVEAFITAYPTLIEGAKTSLASQFNPADYPPAAELKDKFSFDWQIVSLETPDALKEIDPELYAEQAAAAQKNFLAASEEITAVMRETLYELVTHLKERLTDDAEGKPKILKESAINNLKEFLGSFDFRNVTNDEELAVEVAKARSLLNGTSAATLKTNDEWKENLRKGMENVAESLGKMVVNKPGRKFRD